MKMLRPRARSAAPALITLLAVSALAGGAAAKPDVPADLLGKWVGQPPVGHPDSAAPLTVEFRPDATEVVTESALDIKGARSVRVNTYTFTVQGDTVEAAQTGSRVNGKGVPLSDDEKAARVVFHYKVSGDTLTAHGDNTSAWSLRRMKS